MTEIFYKQVIFSSRTQLTSHSADYLNNYCQEYVERSKVKVLIG